MKILVTGGVGFVGSSLVNFLLDRDFSVRVLDKVEGKWEGRSNLEKLVGGIEDEGSVEEAVRGVDVVYHLAESYSAQPREMLDIDVKGNLNLLEKAVKHRVKHFIFTSTTRVYGTPRYSPVDEQHPCCPEISGRPLYAIAKLTNERLCLYFFKEQHLPVTIFRFWWAYGTEVGGRALRNLADATLRGEDILVPQNAGGSFLHNEDIAQAFQLATLNEKAYGEIFNLSSGECTTWQELGEWVCSLAGSSARVKLIPQESWRGDLSLGTDANIPQLWDINITKAIGLLGYRPQYGSEKEKEALRQALRHLVSSRRK